MPMLEIIHSGQFLLEPKQKFAAGALRIFSDVLGTPPGRLRLLFQPVAPDNCIEGLLPGDEQPAAMLLLRLGMLVGRTDTQRADLIRHLSALAADCFAFPLAEIRFVLTQIEPSNWGIGGITIAERQKL